MEIINVFVTSIASLTALFFLTKLMGYRQMSQLSMFDYINGITIGSIAAEMATSDEFLKPLIAMIAYTFVIVCFSIISNKSIKFRRFVEGTPLILFNDEKIYSRNFKKSKIDASEFLVQCRSAGYFDLSDIQTAILESNGKISFIPKSHKRPANPEDFGIYPKIEKIVANIIIDGKIMLDNLKHTGNNIKWLENELAIRKISKINDVFLATCDIDNTLNIYLLEKDEKLKSVLE